MISNEENNFEDSQVKSPTKLIDQLLLKWDKKTSIFKDADDKKTVALLLENQHRSISHSKNSFSFEDTVIEISASYYEEQRSVLLKVKEALLRQDTRGFLAEELEDYKRKLTEIAEELSDLEETEKNQKVNPLEYFIIRGVNLIDEVVKFYDCLECKQYVGIQPMMGPISMAYALRSRPETSTSKGQNSLTLEAKEITARVKSIMGNGNKISGERIAENIDKEVFDEVMKIAISNKVSTEKSEFKKVKEAFDMGTAMSSTKVLVNYETATPLMDTLYEVFDKKDIIFTRNKIPTNNVILAVKSRHANVTGLIFCPYIICNGWNEHDYQIRYTLVTDLYDTENFYQLCELK